MSLLQKIFPDRINIKELRKQTAVMQNSIDILIAGQQETTTNRGNPYKDYKSAVVELAKKYEGTADWGVQQVGNIIDIRSAFIIGQGLKVSCENKESRELEFINKFIEHNDLDEEGPQDLAKEAEIEGKCLVKLIWNAEKKQVDMRFVAYSTNTYTVNSAPDDYKKHESVTYKEAGTQKDVKLEAKEFVYKKFSGRVSKVNEVMPKVAKVLRQCEDLDKALVDWRKINHLFAAPTPHFKCKDATEVTDVYTKLKEINWKLGKMLVTTAEFTLTGADLAGIEALEKEIVTLAKIISGATGVPVHFLGLPDLMSNRAVSTDLFEFINASTNKERHVWEGFYEELFQKVLVIASENGKFGFDTEAKDPKNVVKTQVMQLTDAKLKELVEVWLPLYTANVVDLDYILGKIPDADPEKIKKSNEESAMKMVKQMQEADANLAQDEANTSSIPEKGAK